MSRKLVRVMMRLIITYPIISVRFRNHLQISCYFTSSLFFWKSYVLINRWTGAMNTSRAFHFYWFFAPLVFSYFLRRQLPGMYLLIRPMSDFVALRCLFFVGLSSVYRRHYLYIHW
ncbi:hypothetical protein GCK32_021002 [Trichostrongylus colubriformis]|uniref:Uncharacterized protein n=1 Tax=Trichostrongylus colubriformis TaxID=6319 RepID=A0AAN8F120_TRICO